jgi:multiple sugar transport system permease protein
MGWAQGTAGLLASPYGAWAAVILADAWKTMPFMAILCLTGLSQIPGSVYESSAVDGASSWQTFRFITWPLLKPVLGIAVLLRTLDAFRIFDIVFVMTGGGPGNSTETQSLYTYKILLSQLNFGYGSTLAVFTFLVALALSSLYLFSIRKTFQQT